MNNVSDVEHAAIVEIAVDCPRPAELDSRRDRIDAHWLVASKANPNHFDGAILMVGRWGQEGRRLLAGAFPARFRDYLYWRAEGRPEWGFRHLFGAGVIRLHSGEIVMVRAASGTMNAGTLHLPGGFVDQSDVVDGEFRVVIDGQIARELSEELGLSAGDLKPAGGYLILHYQNEIGVLRLMQPVGADNDLRHRIRAHVAAGDGGAGENTEVDFIHPTAPDAVKALAPYTRPVLAWLAASGAVDP
jgi:hypothetical protein